MERHLRDVRLPDHFPDASAHVGLPQNADFILCAVSLAFYSLWFLSVPDQLIPRSEKLSHVRCS